MLEARLSWPSANSFLECRGRVLYGAIRKNKQLKSSSINVNRFLNKGRCLLSKLCLLSWLFPRCLAFYFPFVYVCHKTTWAIGGGRCDDLQRKMHSFKRALLNDAFLRFYLSVYMYVCMPFESVSRKSCNGFY